jgi:gluconate 5-dehydrogenase
VNVASTLAHTASPGVAPYAAAKGGVVALTRALAVEFAAHGVCCNCIGPGIVDTPLAYVDRDRFAERKHEFARDYPLGRLGMAEDLAVPRVASGGVGHRGGTGRGRRLHGSLRR